MSDTEVLYKGECPICSREIEGYERYAQRRDIAMTFTPLQKTELAAWGLDAETAAKRLHVLQDGKIYDGLEAFQILWAQMPRFGWLARLTRLPVIQPLARRLYDYVLAPLLYAMHRRRIRKSTC